MKSPTKYRRTKHGTVGTQIRKDDEEKDTVQLYLKIFAKESCAQKEKRVTTYNRSCSNNERTCNECFFRLNRFATIFPLQK